MKRGLVRFWHRFKDWFCAKPGPGEPLRFLCGSEEELRRVTIWACHANTIFFGDEKQVKVYFFAATNTLPGRGVIAVPSEVQLAETKDIFQALSTGYGVSANSHNWDKFNRHKWCGLIFKHNMFRGQGWHKIPAFTFSEARWQENGHIFSVFPCFIENPTSISFHVHYPSAHERAEALLALSEWLDGKVSREEKRQLLQLPDDA